MIGPSSVEGLVIPPALAPGDRVIVVAPSSPFEAALGWRGLGVLRQRYRVSFDRGMFSRSGYLAGDDARRAAELERALRDPDAKAIVAARGGYGAGRFVHRMPWDELARRPRWIVGFSDITALHVEAARVGVASMHASHLTMLGGGDAAARDAWIDALERPTSARCHALRAWLPGEGDGVLAGGNLTILHACAAAGRLALPPRAILVIEDVTERPYRIDRVLTGLIEGGHLANVVGVVLGDFTDCNPGPDGVTVDAVLRERLGALGVPVAAGLPVGHGRRNAPLVLGARARLSARHEDAALTISDQR